MNKVTILNEILREEFSRLKLYSKDEEMNYPCENFKNEWIISKEKVRLLKEMVEYEKEQLKKQPVYFLVRDDNYDVLEKFTNLNEAVRFAEEKKRHYNRNYKWGYKVWIETEGLDYKVYEATGEKYFEEEIEEYE